MTHDLEYLVEQAMRASQLNGMQLAIEKELLHYDILFALDKGKFLEGLVFQGGTALRLCHGAPRFSEDLDFAGGADFTSSQQAALGEYLADYISGRYGLETINKPPRELRENSTASEVVTDRWRVSVVTRPSQRDVPRQRIHLEICNVPAHTRELMSLKRNYDVLPDGYEHMMIPVQTKDEILADKLVAFPANLPNHVRWRDMWDLWWLERQGAVVDAELVRAKLRDYGIKNFANLLELAIGRISELISSDAFDAQMRRFLSKSEVENTIQLLGWQEGATRTLQEMLTRLRSQIK